MTILIARKEKEMNIKVKKFEPLAEEIGYFDELIWGIGFRIQYAYNQNYCLI